MKTYQNYQIKDDSSTKVGPEFHSSLDIIEFAKKSIAIDLMQWYHVENWNDEDIGTEEMANLKWTDLDTFVDVYSPKNYQYLFSFDMLF